MAARIDRCFVIPAIDLSEGKVVRLEQGQREKITFYDGDPQRILGSYLEAGAWRVHVVDLDAALGLGTNNVEIIKTLCTTYPRRVEVGGGVRTEQQLMDYIVAGAAVVVVGTLAVTEPETVIRWAKMFSHRVAIAIDARKGIAAIRGWEQNGGVSAAELAKRFENIPIAHIVYTDIDTDGMLCGPNIDSVRALAQHVTCPIVASGGVQAVEDVRQLAQTPENNIIGVIVGKALYEGRIDFSDVASIRKGAA